MESVREQTLGEIAHAAWYKELKGGALLALKKLPGKTQDCWQAAAAAVAEAATSPLLAEISQLRHDLLNEQAASRMAHEVVARNRALEAENAQLRHALANAQVAAGFAKEMAEKAKCYRNALERIAEVGCPTSEEEAIQRYGITWRATVARCALESQP